MNASPGTRDAGRPPARPTPRDPLDTPAVAIPLSAADRPRAAAVLTRAFMDDPAYSFIFPVPASRARYTPLLWSALIHTCRIHGRVYTTESVDGVACWASPGRADLTLGQALRTGFALPRALIRFPQQARKRMLQVLSVLGQERRRLNDKEHWYLEALGVDPPQQGRGVGRLLLAPVLSLADTQGLPCYLETETEANVAFYQKQGFRVLSTLDFPGTPVRMWTMARAPS